MSKATEAIGTSMRKRISFILALALAAFCLLSSSTSAADVSFCAFGTGTGQCKEPIGVAVDRSTGHVYVADSGNDRINVFDEDGSFLSSFGTSGSGAGQLTKPRQVAVDNDPTSPNFHDVYVTDNVIRVQRFSSAGGFEATIGVGQLNRASDRIAVVPGGNLYAFDSPAPGSGEAQVKIFNPAGALLGSSSLGVSIGDATVDSGGDAYVISSGTIKKYELAEPTATLLYSLAEPNTTALAVDPEDNLYTAQVVAGGRVITKHDPSGAVVKRFGFGEIEFNQFGLAVGSGGDAFGSEEYVGSTTQGNKVIRVAQPPPGPLACCPASTPGNTKATLKGTVNPEGKATTFHVDYIAQADYVANGNSFSGANPAISTPESASIGADFDPHNVETQIGCVKPTVPPQASCLKPNTAYRYRLVASNEDGKSEAEGSFTSLPPFEIEDTYATDIGTDAGRIHAIVNPFGIPASGYFEYVDEAAYQADLAEGEGHDGFAEATKVPNVDAAQSPISLGEGEAGKEVARELSGLASDTTYHYRFVVTDSFVTQSGPGHEFTTFPVPTPPTSSCPNQQFRTAASAALPDCRAYEMVSPVDKNGNDIKVLPDLGNLPSRLDQSSADGNRFTYSSSTAFGDAQSGPWSSQYLATRTGAGWSTHSLNAPRESVPLSNQYQMKFDIPYKLFDPELDNGWLVHDAEPALDGCAPPGFINLYRRDNTTGEYEALITAEPPASDPLEGYRLELQGASADGSRTVFRANTRLTPDAANTSGLIAYQLYMHVADPSGEGCGELRLVSFRPNGVVSQQPASAGMPGAPGEHRYGRVEGAISNDGSRVFFTLSTNTPEGSGALYVRVNADQEPNNGAGCTEAGKGCTLEISPSGALFWSAAADGSKAIYSVGSELFEYDVEKALAGGAAKTPIAKGLLGVAGASEDASRIYFVSTEEIDGEGEAGERNLYLYEPAKAGTEKYRLVATLADSDLAGIRYWGLAVAVIPPIKNGVRLTADGGKLAFVSSASLTGYDNADAVDGRPSLELHLYDADTDEVRCISCNPSGARPRGREFFDGKASIHVSAFMAAGENQFFAPRALTEDGNRLFFESFEALLPRDTNGKADVYEWQRAGGEKACEEAGAELYVPSSGGCLSLISTGQSPVDSEFADASPDGHDVFIRTQSSLLPQDDGLIDVYDARIDGGFPQPPGPPAACEGEACQGPLEEPNDPTPASSAFEGAGNVVDEAVASCRKPKVRRKGRCVSHKTRKAHKAAKTHQKHKRKAG